MPGIILGSGNTEVNKPNQKPNPAFIGYILINVFCLSS